jgi:hypothetical protein
VANQCLSSRTAFPSKSKCAHLLILLLLPFIAFSFAFFEMKLQHAQYYICPFIGSALAVLFYEFIFVKT